MCGIAGIIRHHDISEAKAIVKAMNECQRHRGPDDEGVFVNDDIAFAHRRLAIIAPDDGRQPMANEDGSVIVVFNGEIYNYRELRRTLISRGHLFKGASDTETLVHLYEEYGAECTKLLDGMFVFAAYDRRRRRVLLARDRLGKKPLHYFMHGDTLVFASELPALNCHPAMPHELDNDAIATFLALHYIAAPDTIYRDVRKLSPAHQLEIQLDSREVALRRYWSCDYSAKLDIPFDEAARALRDLVEKAVEKRLMSDVPFGVFLSGGVDSTIVAALMTRLRGCETDSFTVGFADQAYDERQYAKIAAEHINVLTKGALRHHELLVTSDDFSVVETLAAHFGEPFGDASMLPTYLVSRFAREQVGMVLGGDGADEVFCGYERYQAMQYAGMIDKFTPSVIRKAMASAGRLLLPDSGERSSCGRLRRLLNLVESEPNHRYFELFGHGTGDILKRLAGERLREALIHSHDTFDVQMSGLTSTDAVEKFAEFDLHSYLPGDILVKLDISTMAASLEARTPFLDRDVVEFAARLPRSYKINGKERKHILRAAFADELPHELRNRPKKGFGVPITKWLRTCWREHACERLFDSPLVHDGYCDAEELKRLWAQHQLGQRDYGHLLWGLMNLGMFLQREESARATIL